MAWISAVRCLNVTILISSSTSRCRRTPSSVISCPFWRVLANFEIFSRHNPMSFGAVLVLPLVVLPAFPGCGVEDDDSLLF